MYQLTKGAWGTFSELIALIFIFCLGLSRVSMWRVAVDVDLGEDGMRRRRYNPFEEECERDFSSKYRFSKAVFTNLLDIVGPSLERNTLR